MSDPSPAEVAVIVRYQAITGLGDKVAVLLGRHAAATRAEPGCRQFVALRGADDPDSFILYEHYDSHAAFEAHLASPHYEGIAVAQIRPLLRARTLEFCQVIAAEEPR
jgi:(4S)-4-hydroxy-5-phosphonooxypentane-2,3-dione isomerase